MHFKALILRFSLINECFYVLLSNVGYKRFHLNVFDQRPASTLSPLSAFHHPKMLMFFSAGTSVRHGNRQNNGNSIKVLLFLNISIFFLNISLVFRDIFSYALKTFIDN